MGFHSYYLYFNIQAGSVRLEDWLSLLTLCLAPLLVHIIVGVPHPVYLHDPSPKWHDRIVHYNPTSIVWRYFVIADRRLRSKDWTASDMAASNALFWTADGWDGTETMMIKSRIYCERRPRYTTVQLFSVSTGKSVIITAQGIQAVSLIINGITRFSRFFIRIGMPNIFFPFAVLGLVRLCAAMWLTEDYTYLQRYAIETEASSSVADSLDKPMPYSRTAQRPSVYSLPAFDFETSYPIANDPEEHDEATFPSINEQLACIASARFHPRLGRSGLAWRIFFLLFLACLWLLPIITMLPFRWGIYFTGTLFSMGIFYFVFLSVTLFSIAACIFTAKSSTTIYPYTSRIWYKAYTCLLFLLMGILIVIAALENRRAPCGTYTTYPSSITIPHNFDFDEFLCDAVRVGDQAQSGIFGLAAQDSKGEVVRGYEGWCMGDFGVQNTRIDLNSSVILRM